MQLLLPKILIAIEQADLDLAHSIPQSFQNLELLREIRFMEKNFALFLLRLLQGIDHILH
jgi:hypothetical protein